MITVVHPGLLSTVQDLGRKGYAHLGVPHAGAADNFSLRIANRLAGNADDEPALEICGGGAQLLFDAETYISLAGGEVEATLGELPVPMYQTVSVPAGATLKLGSIRNGWRCYLAVAGGLRVPRVLGSASGDSFSKLGPPPLQAGTQLATSPRTSVPGFYLRSPPTYAYQVCLRVLPGPQQNWFAVQAKHDFASTAYAVSADSDRSGVRLKGATLARQRPGEMPSTGMVAGAVQVPPDGQPIALLSNHGTTGGYPVIAVVISADLPLLAQLGPGAQTSFSLVEPAEALAELRAMERRLQDDIVVADPGLLAARALMDMAGRHPSLKQASVGDGGRRIRIKRA